MITYNDWRDLFDSLIHFAAILHIHVVRSTTLMLILTWDDNGRPRNITNYIEVEAPDIVFQVIVVVVGDEFGTGLRFEQTNRQNANALNFFSCTYSE